MKAAVTVSALLATAQWGSASLTELIWTLTGLVGIYLSWNNLKDARGYVEALDVVNGTTIEKQRHMRIIAMGHYRNELFRLAIYCVIIGVGVIAMVTPPGNPHKPVSATSVGVTAGFFVITGLLLMGSALDRRQRALLLDD